MWPSSLWWQWLPWLRRELSVAGALAALSAAAWFDFFFTVPYERFTIRSSADITTAVLLLLVGLAVSQLAARARRLKVTAITDAGYLALVSGLARAPESLPDARDRRVRGLITDLIPSDRRASSARGWTASVSSARPVIT